MNIVAKFNSSLPDIKIGYEMPVKISGYHYQFSGDYSGSAVVTEKLNEEEYMLEVILDHDFNEIGYYPIISMQENKKLKLIFDTKNSLIY